MTWDGGELAQRLWLPPTARGELYCGRRMQGSWNNDAA